MESIPKVAEYWLSRAHYMEIALNPYEVPDRNIHTHTNTHALVLTWCSSGRYSARVSIRKWVSEIGLDELVNQYSEIVNQIYSLYFQHLQFL